MAGDAGLAHARAEAARAQSGAYVPAHCWVVTSRSFLDLVAGATRLRLLPFVMNRVSGVEPGGFEFFVSMRRDRETDPDKLRRLQEGGINYLRNELERHRTTAALLGSDAT
ncbi:hypothetical protein ASF22_22115 [Methylobacterium sp. Leaf87]|nr:hypothetical protein ASF22_22115 [Methylobacterium sp. Leaf87]